MAGLGPEAYPVPPLEELADCSPAAPPPPAAARPAHDRRHRPQLGRRDPVDARLSPFQKGDGLDDGGDRPPARRDRRGARRRARPLRGGVGDSLPDKAPMPLKVHRKPASRALAADDARGRALQGLRDDLLPEGADGRPGAEGPAAVAAAEVIWPADKANHAPVAPGLSVCSGALEPSLSRGVTPLLPARTRCWPLTCVGSVCGIATMRSYALFAGDKQVNTELGDSSEVDFETAAQRSRLLGPV